MLKVGDLVLHKRTRQSGKVVGYGHQIVGGVYLPTLTVRVLEETGINPGSFVEDLSSEWLPVESEESPEFLTDMISR
jgi:hypothetical protein